ncbi:MAG: ATP-binding protein [Candidatus Eremiobacteraeota bacterium]|nr:ATP-binding protein [Candidatus Eremiobacteraeota bacterium]
MIWKFDATDGRAAGRAKAALLRSISSQADPSADLVLFELVFSELIANVARHAPKTAFVSFEWRDDGMVLHVDDNGPGFSGPGELPENPLCESGRGLFLVGHLSNKIDVSARSSGGSRVSVWLPVYRALTKAPVPHRMARAYSIG